MIEVGEVGGEAFGGAEAAANLLDGGVVAALQMRAGAGGAADEELENGRLAEDGVLDVDWVDFAVVPVFEVEGCVGVVEALDYSGGEEVVPCGVFGGEPASGSMHDEPLFGVGLFAPDVEQGGVVGVCGRL